MSARSRAFFGNRVPGAVGQGRQVLPGYIYEAWHPANANSASYENQHIRVIVPGAQFPTEGAQIQLVFVGNSTFGVDACYIGKAGESKPDYDGNQKQVTFSGSAGFSVANAEYKFSDWIPFVIKPGKDYVVGFDVVNGSTLDNFLDYNVTNGWACWYKASTDGASSTSVASMTNHTKVVGLAGIRIKTKGNVMSIGALPSIASLNPTHWFRADKGITMDGSNLVSAWADQGSGGKNFVQATGTNQPLWVANSSNFNGMPCVQFDGVDNKMTSASAWTAHVENSLFFFVMRCVASSINKPWIYVDAINPYGILHLHNTSGFGVYNGAGISYFAPFTTNAVILGLLYDWVDSVSLLNSSSANLTMFNGAICSSGAHTFKPDGTTVHLGYDSGSSYANIEIAEIVYFHQSGLSMIEVAAVHRELADRYGITLY